MVTQRMIDDLDVRHAPSRSKAVEWWRNYFVKKGWEWNETTERMIEMVYRYVDGRKRPFITVQRAIDNAVSNGDSPSDFFYYIETVQNFTVDGYYADLNTLKEHVREYIKQRGMMKSVPVNVASLLTDEAEQTADKMSSILNRLWSMPPTDLYSLYLTVNMAETVVSEYINKGETEEDRNRRRETLNRKLEEKSKEDETLRKILMFTGMMDGTGKVNVTTESFRSFYERYVSTATAVTSLNRAVKEFVNEPTSNVSAEGFWHRDDVKQSLNTLENNMLIADHVISLMYGEEGQLIKALFSDVSAASGGAYQMYKEAITRIVAERDTLFSEIHRFTGSKPGSYQTLMSSHRLISLPDGTNNVEIDEWDPITMLLVVRAHESDKTLKTVNDETFNGLLTVSSNAPEHLEGYMFTKDGLSFVDDVLVKVRDDADRTEILSKAVQHISILYNVSGSHKPVERYLSEIGVTARGTLTDELFHENVESTEPGHIKVKPPESRVEDVAGVPELNEEVLNQWNRFVMNLNITETNRYNYDQVERFIGASGISAWFPEPFVTQPELKMAVLPERVVSNLDNVFRRVLEGLRLLGVDRVDVYAPFLIMPGTREIEVKGEVYGPRGAGEVAVYSDSYWDRINAEGQVVEKTLVRSVSSHTNNMYMYGLLLYDSFVSWASERYKDTEMGLESVDDEFNAKLNAVSNGANFVVLGHVDRSERKGMNDSNVGSSSFDIYVLHKGRWYRVIYDRSFNDFLNEQAWYAEMMRDFGSVPVIIGATAYHRDYYSFSSGDYGYFVGAEVPITVSEKEGRAAGLIVKGEKYERVFSGGVLRAGERPRVRTLSLIVTNQSVFPLPSVNVALKYEDLILDTMRTIAFAEFNDYFRVGGAVEKKNWSMGALWNFHASTDTADLVIGYGIRNVHVFGMRTNTRMFYRLRNEVESYGAVSRCYVDDHRWLTFYGNRQVGRPQNTVEVRNADEISDSIEDICSDLGEDYPVMESDASVRRTMLKSYAQRLSTVVESLRNYAPVITSTGPQFLGIGYTNARSGLDAKLTWSTVPINDKEMLYTVGMFDYKGFGLLFGTPVSYGDETLGGVRIGKGDWSLALWSGRRVAGLELGAKLGSKTVAGGSFTRFNQGWQVEGYIGNGVGWRVMLDVNQLNKLSVYGVSLEERLTASFQLKVTASYAAVSEASDPVKALKQTLFSGEMNIALGRGTFLRANLSVTGTSVNDMSFPVVEGKIQFTGPLPFSQ